MKEKLQNNTGGPSKNQVIPSWCNTDKIKPMEKEKNWFSIKHNLRNKFVVLYSGNHGEP